MGFGIWGNKGLEWYLIYFWRGMNGKVLGRSGFEYGNIILIRFRLYRYYI